MPSFSSSSSTTERLSGTRSRPELSPALRWRLRERDDPAAAYAELGSHVERRQGPPERERTETVRERAGSVARRDPRLVIVGAPGQGKSTLLRHWLLEAAGRWLERPGEQPFPVYLRLSDWETRPGPRAGRLPAMAREAAEQGAEGETAAATAWLKGPVLWLLDGIDEIRDAHHRATLQDEVRALAAERPADRWIVTTRPAGEPPGGFLPGWGRHQLPAFTDRQVEAVLGRWAEILKQKEELTLDHRAMARSLIKDAGLRQLRGNALMLTLAVLFYKARRRLPHDRWEFYESAEQALRDSWVRQRLERAGDVLPEGNYLPVLLERLALSGMKDGRVLFDRATVEGEIRTLLKERGYTGREIDQETTRCLRAAEDVIGVLVEQAHDRFGFLHLTFQEFLAARALVHDSAGARAVIAFFWDHPDWEEMWKLYALGIQKDPARHAELFEIIQASRNSEYDNDLHRDKLACLRLAGVGLAPLPEVAEKIVAWASNILTRPRYPVSTVVQSLAQWERQVPTILYRDLLCRFGDDGVTGEWAADAIATVAHQAVVRGHLLAGLRGKKEGDWSSRYGINCARALREISLDSIVSHELLKCLDQDIITRRSAAESLSYAAFHDEGIRKELFTRLGDTDPKVRDCAARALIDAASLSDVCNKLLNLVSSTDHYLRAAVLQALAGAIDQQKVVECLILHLDDPEDDVRRQAVLSLNEVAIQPLVCKAILSRLGDNYWEIRKASAFVLSKVAHNPDVLDGLIAKLSIPTKGRNEFVNIKSNNKRALLENVIFAMLDHQDHDVAVIAESLLGWFIIQSDDIENLIKRVCSRNGDWVFRKSAAASLACVSNYPDVRKFLIKLLYDDEALVAESAARALIDAVHFSDVCGALLERLGDKDQIIVTAASDSLAPVANRPLVKGALLKLVRDHRFWENISVAVATAAAASLTHGLAIEKFGLRR